MTYEKPGLIDLSAAIEKGSGFPGPTCENGTGASDGECTIGNGAAGCCQGNIADEYC